MWGSRSLGGFVGLVILGVVVFATTDIDDIFLLIGFFADRQFRAHQIVLGQYLGMSGIIAAALVCSLVSLVIPASYIGFLGILPIAIGAGKLRMLWRREPSDAETHSTGGTRNKVITVALVTVANGGDNVGVYGSLFATREAWENWVLTLVFLAMTAVWCLIAHYLVNHLTLGLPIRKYGHLILPFALIGLGYYILSSTGALALVR
jgi:cadmium resistance protein CadD (predicted permease)